MSKQATNQHMGNWKFRPFRKSRLDYDHWVFLWIKNTKSCLNKQKVPDSQGMLWFNFICGLKFSRPVWFLFPYASGCDNEYDTKNEK